MEVFLAIEAANLTLYVFLLIIFLSFLFMFLLGDNEEKTYQKIIGGLSVFVVTIISANAWVFFTSLFIGGLIIASEKFLKSLAAILKSDSTTMPQTIEALNQGELSHASEAEIVEEKEKEVKEVEEHTSAMPKPERLSFEQLRQVERKIIKILTEKYLNCFTPNLKFENKYGAVVVDGVIHHSNDAGKLNLDNALTLVEIKYIGRTSNPYLFESIARRVLEKIRYLLVSKQVMILFYAKNLTMETAEKMNERLSSLFSKDTERDDVVFGFVNIDENLNPEPLLLGDLKSHVIR